LASKIAAECVNLSLYGRVIAACYPLQLTLPESRTPGLSRERVDACLPLTEATAESLLECLLRPLQAAKEILPLLPEVASQVEQATNLSLLLALQVLSLRPNEVEERLLARINER